MQDADATGSYGSPRPTTASTGGPLQALVDLIARVLARLGLLTADLDYHLIRASMVLIHPLLRANAHRRRKVHLVLFLILLVANASGALTPLGNPPLYLGLLHGVPFFWPARHLLTPLLVVTVTEAWPTLPPRS